MVQREAPTPSEALYDPEVLQRYCRREKVRLLVLFGSRAFDRAGPQSDVDLALQFPAGVQADKLRLIFDLEEIFFPRRVDLVILTPLTPPLLLHEIFSQGGPLYEDAPEVFRMERLRAWKLYQDTASLRELEKRALERYVRRRRHVS